MNWKPFDTAPKKGVFLVYLPEERKGSRIHTMRRHPNVSTIGHVFAFDLKKPALWCEIPTLPEGEDNAPEW